MRTPRTCADAAAGASAVEVARRVSARPGRLRVATRADGRVLNSYRDRSWDEGALPTLPYAVYLARDGAYYRLAFDLDASKGDVDADALVLRGWLGEAGVRFIEAVSGPGGGRHLIAVFEDPLPAAQVAALARHLHTAHLPTLDPSCLCNPATGSIRPPGAPHRHGGVSRLLTPAPEAAATLEQDNHRAAFDRLCAITAVPPQPDNVVALPEVRVRRVLSLRLRRLERDGDVEGRYRDRSAVAAAIALGYLNAGWSFEEFATAALDPANRGLDHLRRTHQGRGRYQARTQLQVLAAAERLWRGRQRYAEQHPAAPPKPAAAVQQQAELVASVRAAADAVPRRWGGQAGRSDRAVLDAFLEDAGRWSEQGVPASARRLAERAGLGRSSAARALHRLARDGWLEPVSPASGPQAATYHPAVPDQLGTGDGTDHASARRLLAGGPSWDTNPAPPTRVDLSTVVAIQSHDAFTSDGLGRYAAAVYTALVPGAATPALVAARAGLSLRTVRRHLHRLAAAGLVRASGRQWRTRGLDRLDDAAAVLGAAGVVARRADTHDAERDAYRWWLADFAACRGWTTERGLRQPGRWTLTGTDPRPAPSVPFPRHPDGRRHISKGLRQVQTGLGPSLENLELCTSTSISPATAPAARPPAPRRAPSRDGRGRATGQLALTLAAA
ncbi:MAG: helix-turn-helix domain-containing protein [Motilibacteraceae bacterium]